MKKNVASQTVGAQMVDATTGAAFTGSVTVYVTGDAGTQAVGSVGSGACTHEGNGYHSYAPSQAETNYDHVAFTFIGTGAVPVTVQTWTHFPQTGDSFARIGAPVGASISADVAAVKTQTGAIETDTQDIQSRLPAALVSGRIDASVGAMANNTMTAAAAAADLTTELQTGLATSSALSTLQTTADNIYGVVDTEVAAIKAKTDNLPSDPADASDIASAFSTVNSNLTTIANYIDTEVAAIKAKTDNLPSDPASASTIAASFSSAGAALTTIDTVVDAIQAKTDNLPAAPAATGDIPTANENADALLDRANGVETGFSVRQAMRLMLASLAGKLSGAATTTVAIRDANDSKDRITATVDADGNRTAVTLDAS